MDQYQKCRVLRRSLQLRKQGYPAAEAEFIAAQDIMQHDENVAGVENGVDNSQEIKKST